MSLSEEDIINWTAETCEGCGKPILLYEARYTGEEPEKFWHFACYKDKHPFYGMKMTDAFNEIQDIFSDGKPGRARKHRVKRDYPQCSVNAERILKGLGKHGITPVSEAGYCPAILRYCGQPGMNRAAGEAASTWRLVYDNSIDSFEFQKDGQPLRITDYVYETGSFLPVGWILKFPPEQWDVDIDHEDHKIVIYVDEIPPNWK